MKQSQILMTLIAFFSTGCSVLLGNVKPVTEKSIQFQVTDLSVEDPSTWVKLPPSQPENLSEKQPTEPNEETQEVSDLAFQSRITSAIISINSSCRKRNSTQQRTLQEFSNELLFGFTDVISREEYPKTLKNLRGQPGLATELQGKLNSEPLRLSVFVQQVQTCVYDLMYISKPDSYSRHIKDFERFLDSFSVTE